MTGLWRVSLLSYKPECHCKLLLIKSVQSQSIIKKVVLEIEIQNNFIYTKDIFV